MSYATKDDLVNRFGIEEILELAGSEGDVVDDQAVNAALADADAEIDGYLASVTTVPAPTNANLTRIACDIARYRLYDEKAHEVVRQRYQDAMRYLERVATGQIALENAQDGDGPTLSHSGNDQVFTMDTLADF